MGVLASSMKTPFSKEIMDIIGVHAERVTDPFNQCFSASTDLIRDVGGIQASGRVVQFQGLLIEAPDADPRWSLLPRSSWLHHASLIDGFIVDITWRQFFPKGPKTFIQSLEDAQKLWSRCFA